jgi:OTU-like cysteine protease
LVDLAAAQLRNAAVEKQLADKHLRTINVEGDGNCFYRAISVGLYGTESHCNTLRKSVALHMLDHGERIFAKAGVGPVDSVSLHNASSNISQDFSWAGQDAILAAADLLNRDIYVYVSGDHCSPIVHSPTSLPCLQPIQIAFFEPGHYRAVLPASESLSSDTVPSVQKQGN